MQNALSVTQENRRIVQAMYEAGARGEIERVVAFLDESVVIFEPPYLPYGGIYRGRDGFRHLLGEISKYLDLSKLTVDYLVADHERVFGVLRARDRNGGQEVLLAEQSTLRAGKVIEMRIFYFDAATLVDQKRATPP
jgi:uncharacterized protein